MSAFGKHAKDGQHSPPIAIIDSPISNEIGRCPILMGEGLTSSRFGPTMFWRSTVALDVRVLYWAGTSVGTAAAGRHAHTQSR